MPRFERLDEVRAASFAGSGAYGAGAGAASAERRSLLGREGSGGDQQPRGADRHDKTPMWLTACNFMNGVVGAGIIGLPGAIAQAGLIMGLVLFVVVALVGDWTIRLLAALGAAHGADSYEGLA
jgi:sodium-coupled neutral amino acid transporter 11